jgi:hypothetical protein
MLRPPLTPFPHQPLFSFHNINSALFDSSDSPPLFPHGFHRAPHLHAHAARNSRCIRQLQHTQDEQDTGIPTTQQHPPSPTMPFRPRRLLRSHVRTFVAASSQQLSALREARGARGVVAAVPIVAAGVTAGVCVEM